MQVALISNCWYAGMPAVKLATCRNVVVTSVPSSLSHMAWRGRPLNKPCDEKELDMELAL